jgi:REP element-mobilizing transposase RayT
VDAYLDSGAGACWLAQPEIAKLVQNALLHFESQRYELLAWCVMPNHVHSVLRPASNWVLESILHSWKSYTASEANRVLSRKGQTFWQHESYDHVVRNENDLQHCVIYTEENPVKAGLCKKPEDWPWSSARRRSP